MKSFTVRLRGAEFKLMRLKTQIAIHERTNQRDGTVYVLEYQDATPLCPHCGAKMALVNGTWENCRCTCWWKGSNDANYYAQVVVADSPQDEFAFRNAIEDARERANAEHAERLMTSRIAYAAADAAVKFQIIHDLRYLWGKRQKKARARVREIIALGGDFDDAMKA